MASDSFFFESKMSPYRNPPPIDDSRPRRRHVPWFVWAVFLLGGLRIATAIVRHEESSAEGGIAAIMVVFTARHLFFKRRR